MEGEEWVVGATYTNKHNGGRIMVELREIMDSGTILFKAKRVGGADEGQITFLSKRDIRHWEFDCSIVNNLIQIDAQEEE